MAMGPLHTKPSHWCPHTHVPFKRTLHAHVLLLSRSSQRLELVPQRWRRRRSVPSRRCSPSLMHRRR